MAQQLRHRTVALAVDSAAADLVVAPRVVDLVVDTDNPVLVLVDCRRLGATNPVGSFEGGDERAAGALAQHPRPADGDDAVGRHLQPGVGDRDHGHDDVEHGGPTVAPDGPPAADPDVGDPVGDRREGEHDQQCVAGVAELAAEVARRRTEGRKE